MAMAMHLAFSACCFSRGQASNSHRISPPAAQTVRSSASWSTRACVENRFEVGENASSLQKIVLRSVNGTHGASDARVARIRRQLLQGAEYSPSSYDVTAWVAMVQCFPQCLEWILQNQHSNGSWSAWGMQQTDASVDKDLLSSTLACVLALHRWNVGREHIRRGLDFIGRNHSIFMDEQMAGPTGFKVIFHRTLCTAIEIGLEVPIRQIDMDRILLHLQKMEVTREPVINSCGTKTYMTYITEGLGNMKHFLRKNGSLFNSPPTTTDVLLHNHDAKALQYLGLRLNKSDSAAVYPKIIHCQLSMVDALENMGISRHFTGEIKSILDMTYRCWLQRDEEIMLDITTCAMAFRILRMNGYDVSSDDLFHIAEASDFNNSLQGYLNDARSLLELYKASEVRIMNNEFILDNIGSWSGCFLKELLSSSVLQVTSPIIQEVEHALNCPFHATLDRLDHKRNIEHFSNAKNHMLETTSLPCQINQDLLALGVKDFSTTQSIYQEELQCLNSWVKDNRLDKLPFARQKSVYFYLSAAGTIIDPELSDARIEWAKNGVLTTVVDDFFDVGGSEEELENLVSLAEMWDQHHKREYYSEHVEIVFSAIYNSVKELAAKASAIQGHDVTNHLIEIWLDLLRSMMTEVEWRTSKYVPTTKEYISNAVVTFALGPIVLPALYLVGPKISESVIRDPEYSELFRLMSTCGRLLNDVQTYEREGGEGKLNSVSLLVLHSGGSVSIEEARREIQEPIDACRRDLLRLVLREGEGGGSVVPRPCKELFWKMCKVCHFFYLKNDGFTSLEEKAGAVNAVIHEPLNLKIGEEVARELEANLHAPRGGKEEMMYS